MKPHSILIVEDEAVSALDIKTVLSDMGYRVTGIASTGEDAIRAVDADVPDLILMDIHLAGELTGIEAAEKILATRAIPIIYLTAHSEPDLVGKAKVTRPYGYIIKPFTERALQTGIEIALYKSELDREYQREHARLKEWADQQTREIRQANEALQASEQKFREFVSLLPEIVFECDLTGKLILVNENSLRFFGYTKEDLARGLNLFDHIVPEDRERVLQGITRIAGGGMTSGSEYTGLKRDGTRFPLRVYSTRVIENGKCTGIRGILVNISDQKNAENAMQQAIRKLGILNSITRHDILNKLSALESFLCLVGEGVTDEKTRDYLKGCTEVTATIDRHIQFMRDYQEIGIQAPVWQDPATTVRQVAENSYCPDMAIRVPDPGWEIFADPLFEKVIYNLIENAVRHGGHITAITFTVKENEEGLFIIYEDNGVGIPEEAKKHIFEKGFGKNTGLGLFLAREILSITGISIRETGIYGTGARFEILVPKGTYRRALPAPAGT